MKKITIRFEVNGLKIEKVAVLNDDLTDVIINHPDNEAITVTTGIANELGVWNIIFLSRRHEYEFDFFANVDEEGNETLLLEPCEALIWNRDGKLATKDTIRFTAEIAAC